MPPRLPPARHQASDRTPRHRKQPEAGQALVGHRAHIRLDQPLPPPGHPLRMQARHPHALTALACSLICLNALQGSFERRCEARLWLDGPFAPEGRVEGAARRLFLDLIGIPCPGEERGRRSRRCVYGGASSPGPAPQGRQPARRETPHGGAKIGWRQGIITPRNSALAAAKSAWKPGSVKSTAAMAAPARFPATRSLG